MRFLVAAFALFRVGTFIHEIVHLRRGTLPGFVAAWNVVVGIIGSFIGNSVFSFLLGGGSIGGWPPDMMGILSALIGAVVLLGVLNLIQRGKMR